jgi:twitching motility protein PilT
MDPLPPPEEEMKRLLEFVTKNQASDLHLKVNYPPYVRIGGHLRHLQQPPLPDSGYVHRMIMPLMPVDRSADFEEHGALDFSTGTPGGDRYRVNVFRSTGDMHVAIRRVQSNIPDFEELHLPPVYRDVISKTLEGLVLVCGVTGCGKSSTLAAMLNFINHTRALHVITIEDPIEYAFHPKLSIISQREVGLDVPSFAEALRSVVRQDPDCILIGELRDRDTMLAALQAAETGHLVLGSLHCSDAQQSFSRILEFFPRAEHSFIRSSLSASLKAMMCQRLIPGVKENSRYPATEVLLGNSIVKDKILHEEDDDIPAILYQCRDEGMRSFTHSLSELTKADLISREVAMDFAPSREALLSALKGIETTGQSMLSRLRG